MDTSTQALCGARPSGLPPGFGPAPRSRSNPHYHSLTLVALIRAATVRERSLSGIFHLCSSVFICGLFFSPLIHAGVIDRVAVVVGTQVITQSEVEEDLRVTAFQNQEPLDLSPAKRREAAERLVDQELIRNEMQLENVAQPPASDVNSLIDSFRRQHFASETQLEAALRKYGITRQELGDHLLWQQAALKFVDMRFRGPAIGPAPAVQSANRMRDGATPPPASDDPQLDAWLKEARSQNRIEFKQEAFQ